MRRAIEGSKVVAADDWVLERLEEQGLELVQDSPDDRRRIAAVLNRDIGEHGRVPGPGSITAIGKLDDLDH